MQPVGQHMNVRVLPWKQLAIEPNPALALVERNDLGHGYPLNARTALSAGLVRLFGERLDVPSWPTGPLPGRAMRAPYIHKASRGKASCCRWPHIRTPPDAQAAPAWPDGMFNIAGRAGNST